MIDTTVNNACSSAVILVLKKDSSLFRFARTDKNGTFLVQNIPPGQYILDITHPYYSDYSEIISINDGRITNLGIIQMKPVEHMLAAVIVTPTEPSLKIKGDTLEYNTMNIKTRVNATIEELLTLLPGVQVDANGVITVNGQKVQRLLVDGEDFFGGDPTIVTRNLNADMIAKVQILDRKSDQAKFTGIDDGNRTKTINLTLRPDSKRGLFGKISAGGGDPQGYHNINGLLGSFKDRQQFAALAMTANNGYTGFAGGDDGSGLDIGGTTYDALGASAGAGIPLMAGGGIHYANTWNNDGNHLTLNSQYGHLTTNPYSSSVIRQTLPGSIYTQVQNSKSANKQDQQALNIDYDYIPDTLTAWRFSIATNSMHGQNDFLSTGNSRFNDTLANSSLRSIHSNVNNQNVRANTMWRINGAKQKNRIFSAIIGLFKQNNTTNGFLYSLNNFYDTRGNPMSTDTIDQRKLFNSNSFLINTDLNFAQPLWKNTILGLSYGFSFNKRLSGISSYNKSEGKYEEPVDSLSSRYQNNVLTNTTTVTLQGASRTLNYTIGSELSRFIYKQIDLVTAKTVKYQYQNFAPRINFRYNIRNYRSLSFDYNGNTQQPAISQLQPIQNNNDPLHLTIGNPNLNPSFLHNFNLAFHDSKPLIIYLKLIYGFAANGISTRTITDSLGRQISQAVNVNGSSYSGLDFTINKKLANLKLDLGLNSHFNYVRSVNYVNQYLSRNNNHRAAGGLSITRNVPNKYSIQFNANWIYTSSNSSINASTQTNYWTQSHNGQITIYFLRNFQISSNVIYNWRQKISPFDMHNSTVFWNANINRNLFENKLAIKLEISDILAQNVGFVRTTNANQTTQNISNIIGRYWMLSATWRFTRRKKENQP